LPTRRRHDAGDGPAPARPAERGPPPPRPPRPAAAPQSRVAGRVAGRAARRGREVVVDPISPELRVEGDELRLEQALGNLVGNALAHGAGTIRLSAAAEPAGCVLGVRDEGPGVPLAFLPHAFERFGRADQGRTGRGTGLGLAIVRAIAEAHGGSAELENLPGGGGVVARVVLPRASDGAVAQGRVQGLAPDVAGADASVARPCRPVRDLESGAGNPTATWREALMAAAAHAEELLMIEEADAWFEYLEATRGQSETRYAEVEPWAFARLSQRLRAVRARRARLRPAAA
jgi:hypothetical protein